MQSEREQIGALSAGYKYGLQLRELERRSQEAPMGVPEGARKVVTPLVWTRWEELLKDHPTSGGRDIWSRGSGKASDSASLVGRLA